MEKTITFSQDVVGMAIYITVYLEISNCIRPLKVMYILTAYMSYKNAEVCKALGRYSSSEAEGSILTS